MTNKITQEEAMEYLGSLTVMELNGFVKKLEEKWGVSAAAPVAVAAAPAGTSAAPAAEEKTEFTLMLNSFPEDKKIAVIKAVRAITGLGLSEAKGLVEGAPKAIKESVGKEDAEKFKKELEAAGAVVELK